MTDLPPRFVPGSTGLPILRENQINGMVHEAVVQWRLDGAGYEVTNLNMDVMNNFPIADLVASNGKHRLLIQVRSAVADTGAFRIQEAEITRLDRLASILGHHGVYAFVFHEVGVEFRTTAMMLRKANLDERELGDCAFLCGTELAIRLDQMVSDCDSQQVTLWLDFPSTLGKTAMFILRRCRTSTIRLLQKSISIHEQWPGLCEAG